MMTETLSATQARALAALVHELRQDWDATGILTALRAVKDRATPANVAIAAIRAASTPTNRTPAVIALDGPHWLGIVHAADPRVEPARCAVPGHEHEFAHNCRACVGDRMAAMAPDGDADLTISAKQAARNEHGAAAVRAEYVRPAWLDQPAERETDE